ncbi:MAG: transposase [Nitrospira sp.]|nr:transposase [Nitrospira sp.]
MATECIPQLTFEFHPKMKTVARFDQAHASTDGGVVLLRAVDEQLQLTERLAACLPDGRDPDKIRHAMRELLQQRVFGLACGYVGREKGTFSLLSKISSQQASGL